MNFSDKILQGLEKERKSLLRYYKWQIFWGVLFLVLVFVSSIYLGFRSEKFWLYIVIPLIVAGSFWIYIQSTYQSVSQKYNQKVLKALLPEIFPGWQFYPVFKIDRKLFENAYFVNDYSSLESKDAIIGNLEERNILITYLKAEKRDYDTDIYAFAGTFITVEQKFSLPEFGVYPKSANVSGIKQKLNLVEVPVKLATEFTVLLEDEFAVERVDFLGPVILKYAHLCSDVENFYFSSFNGRINIGINDRKEIVSLDLKHTVSRAYLEERLGRLINCEKFIEELGQRVKLDF